MKTIYESSGDSEISLQFIYNNKSYFYKQLREIEQTMIKTRCLYQLDLESYRIEQYNVAYRKDIGPPEIIFNNSAYFIFDYSKNVQVEVTEFQIQSLNCRPVKKTVIFESRGCITNYKNYLISSFGYYLITTEQFSNSTNNYVTFDSGESSNKVQIYNLTNWEQVDSIAPMNENEDSHADPTISNNGNSLIEGTVGGILVIISIVSIVLFLVYRHQSRKKRAPSFIIDPIYIKPINPLDTKNEYYNTEIFSHSQEIDDAITILPIDMHIEALKATNINKEKASY